MAGQADIGWSNSLGWYEGFSLLTATDPTGIITGFCFAAASTGNQQMAESFFAMRAQPNRRLISVGSAAAGPSIADKGFECAENHLRWLQPTFRTPFCILENFLLMIPSMDDLPAKEGYRSHRILDFARMEE